MHLLTLNQKPLKVTKMKERYCKGQSTETVSIPVTWGLNELQCRFIDSMIDTKSNK